MDPTLTSLRVLREIAERGTFTAAASTLGYTQSAVSRQIAALEREVGAPLFDRRAGGVRLTTAGTTLLRHARVVLDELAAAERELAGTADERSVVRVGVYVSAGATLLPSVVPSVRRTHPEIDIITREGTTPALVRAVRAGTLDLAVVTSRPPYPAPDAELPRLAVETLAETDLLVAAPAAGRFAGRDSVTLAELGDVDWIASPSTGTDPLLGIWPGLPGRPRVVHSARDWLTKLRLVAAGCGVTTVPTTLADVLPAGVTTLQVVDASPPERRRMRLVRLPGPIPEPTRTVARAIRAWRG